MEQQEIQPVQEIQPKNTKKLPPVDKATYDKYTSLKFSELSGIKLEKIKADELSELEKQLLKCSGKKPIRTQRAAINADQVLIVEGIPLPVEYQEIIENSSNPAYYFGNAK
jgi:hypothetical protein